MAPGNKKRNRGSGHAAPTSPFKRLKAKVGKKAPQAPNYTNTEFKAALIRVARQDHAIGVGKSDVTAATTTTTELVSGKGRLAAELQSQMHHPSAAVRVSAIKGILDIIHRHVNSNTTNTMTTLAAHLSVLWSAIGKASVEEEDDEVRQVGFTSFQKLLSAGSNRNNNNSDMSSSTTIVTGQKIMMMMMIKPFLPLILAYFKSALNSLDRDTRRDGLRFVHALFTHAGFLLDRNVVASILPALVRIWDDKAFQAASSALTTSAMNQKSTKKQKKKNNKKFNAILSSSSSPQIKSGRYSLLECLLALLSSTSSLSSEANYKNSFVAKYGGQPPTMVYNPGGRSKNALVFASIDRSGAEQTNLIHLETIQDLPSFADLDHGRIASPQTNTPGGSDTAGLSLETACNLFGKLRDTLIELQQNECLETLHLLVQAVDAVWHSFGEDIVVLAQMTRAVVTSQQQGRVLQDLESTCQQLRTLLLESFPFQPIATFTLGSPTTCSALVDSINGRACLALVRMTHYVDILRTDCKESSLLLSEEKKQKSSSWLKSVVEYICYKLQDKSLLRPGNEASHETILQVLCSLLDDDSNREIVLIVPRLEKKLVKAFTEDLLPKYNAGESISTHIAASKGGLISFQIARAILGHADNQLSRAGEMFGEERVLALVLALPDFLLAWRDNHYEYSASLIRLLSLLFRTTSPAGEEPPKIASIVEQMRKKLEGIVQAEVAVTDKDQTTVSLFGLYPSYLQRHAIGLYTTLEAPTPTTLSCLSNMCALTNLSMSQGRPISNNVVAFLINSMFQIRKTIPMQQFIGFLVDSTGATSPTFVAEMPDTKRLVQYDQGLQQVCKSLVCCGVEKIMPMLSPMIVLFLEVGNRSSSSPARQQLRRRFVFSLLAFFALELKNRDTATSLIDLLPPSAPALITESIHETLAQTDSSYSSTTLVVAPILALLFAESRLLLDLVVSVMVKLPTEEESGQEDKVLRALLNLAQDNRLADVSGETLVRILEVVKQGEKSVSGTVATVLLAQVLVALEVLIGKSQDYQ